jgi:hypothetical protein
MSDDPYRPPDPSNPAAGPPPQPPYYGQQPPPAYAQPTAPYGYVPAPAAGPVGQVRSTGLGILLYIITLGIYGWFWWYKVHDEMRRHNNGQTGLGGPIALILAIFVSVVMPYLTSDEVGNLYERRGQPKPVSALTGLWYFPGIFLFGIGPIVWFVKTNGALNSYWQSLGAR